MRSMSASFIARSLQNSSQRASEASAAYLNISVQLGNNYFPYPAALVNITTVGESFCPNMHEIAPVCWRRRFGSLWFLSIVLIHPAPLEIEMLR